MDLLLRIFTSITLWQGYVSFLVDDFDFMNTALSWEDRVNDLVKRLTPREMASLMQHGGTGSSPAIARLGIKEFSWDTECLRGDASAGLATAFPQSIGLAAAWSPSLIHDIAEATSIEVHAKYNDYIKHNQHGYHKGISCFSPVINIMRHPLWGRNQETYGEDPYLSGLYSQHYVQGLHGNHSRYLRTNAGCKHFAVHDGPDNFPESRFSFNAEVNERDLHVTYLPQFRMCVQGGTYNIMCSYNRLNGIPACANHKLLTEILRDTWGFKGYVISDQQALPNIITEHKYLNNTIDAAAACVNAGCNLELYNAYEQNPNPVYASIYDAFVAGKISDEMLRDRVKPLFMTRMRLGDFDPDSMNPYSKLDLSVVQSQEHRNLATRAAIESFVLLKNVDNFLPLSKTKYNKIAFVGPMTDNSEQLFGDYAATINPKYTTTPYNGLKSLGLTVTHANGCPNNQCKMYNKAAVISATSHADIVFACLGTGVEIEQEFKDRHDMNLPGHQLQILQDAVQHSNNAPIVLLLFSGGPVDISWAESNPNVKAIIQAGFPAQATGEALRRALTAESDVGLAGRLPYTWYKSLSQTGPITDYNMTGKTYRYFTGEPAYPFGYGLSYSTFHYSSLKVQNGSLHAGNDQLVTFTVANTGRKQCCEVVQVYISRRNPSQPMPKMQLVAFDRISSFAPNGGSKTLSFTIRADFMAVWHEDRGFIVEPGTFDVFVGGEQPNQLKTVGSNVLRSTFTISGNRVLGKI